MVRPADVPGGAGGATQNPDGVVTGPDLGTPFAIFLEIVRQLQFSPLGAADCGCYVGGVSGIIIVIIRFNSFNLPASDPARTDRAIV